MTEDASTNSEVVRLIKSGKKLQAIKRIREESGIGLKEAKDQADAIQEQLIEAGQMERPSAAGCGAVVLILILPAISGTIWLFT